MKIFKLRSLFLLTFFSLVFVGCEDEPLEGEFVVDEPTADPGQFVATIDGEQFTASSVEANIINGGLVVVGINDAGQSVSINVLNKSECVFNLDSAGAFGGYIAGGNVYSSFAVGTDVTSGSLEITSYNTEDLLVSGTFEFVAVENIGGQAGTATVTITDGSFTAIPINVVSGDVEPSECDPTGGGSSGGGGSGTEPDTLFAVVDGVDFFPTSVEVLQYMVGMEPMIQVKANDSISESTVRIDIPENLLTGTFDMFNGISDGTRLIGYYSDNNGGETLSSNPGTITITEFNSQTGRLAANFNFTATDPLNTDPTVVQITEGTFDVGFVPTPGNVSFFFEANVNGNPFEPETAIATQSNFEGVDIITISATIGDRLMELNFPASVGPGTYGMSPLLVSGNEVVGSYSPDVMEMVTFTSDPGTLEIVSFDTTTGVIEGTFSFTAKDATLTDPAIYEITDGSFIVELQ
ncbi:MAG: DUF6252 family protein [Marinirhabdus sp.]|nr:DUF6252 family protein [Marinirhabdus sp.]